MIRLGELALFVMPLALFIAWRVAGPERFAPTRSVLAVLLAGLLMLGAGLAWMDARDRHPEGTTYVPAQWQDGRVVPGHGS